MNFPKKEAETLLAWMKEQMYGDVTTEWTYGNEHDYMADCADLIRALAERYSDSVEDVDCDDEDEDEEDW